MQYVVAGQSDAMSVFESYELPSKAGGKRSLTVASLNWVACTQGTLQLQHRAIRQPSAPSS
jgi:hypothetical protein